MKLSVLNLVPLRHGETFRDAIDQSIALAQHVEALQYERYWIAEHHNMKSVASSATSLLIGHTLANTSTLTIGSGGVMLPNHSPYLIAEQFGTLATLYPNRVDLGLGRAPGTDMDTARAIRRTSNLYPDFETELAELRSYFDGTAAVHAYPAEGIELPFYILGSSTDSAVLAAKLGLPYAFAAHFAPTMMDEAIQIYRSHFTPSRHLEKPYVILGINAILADTDEHAEQLATTQTQAFLNIVAGTPSGLQPPVANNDVVFEHYISSGKVPHFGPIAFQKEQLLFRERLIVQQMSAVSLIGSKERVHQQLHSLTQRVQVDELMVNSYIYNPLEQQYSYTLLAEIIRKYF